MALVDIMRTGEHNVWLPKHFISCYNDLPSLHR
jgi:hypothetical protein